MGRAHFSCEKFLEYLKQLAQVSVQTLAKELNIKMPTAWRALNHMLELGILIEVSGRERGKVYVYKKYLDILEDGADPL